MQASPRLYVMENSQLIRTVREILIYTFSQNNFWVRVCVLKMMCISRRWNTFIKAIVLCRLSYITTLQVCGDIKHSVLQYLLKHLTALRGKSCDLVSWVMLFGKTNKQTETSTFGMASQRKKSYVYLHHLFLICNLFLIGRDRQNPNEQSTAVRYVPFEEAPALTKLPALFRCCSPSQLTWTLRARERSSLG